MDVEKFARALEKPEPNALRDNSLVRKIAYLSYIELIPPYRVLLSPDHTLWKLFGPRSGKKKQWSEQHVISGGLNAWASLIT